MSLKAFNRSWLAGLALALSTGCAVHVPTTTTTVAPSVTSASWVEQIKLSIEQPAQGPRVAAKLPSSWHRVELTVGRLDGTAPVRKLTLDPFESRLSGRSLDSVVPGDDYWVQVDLVHVDGGRDEWVVGSGRLGGGGQVVRFHAGPNGLPIVVKPVVAGSRLDTAPTPLKRRSSTRSSGIIYVETSSSTTISNFPSAEDEPVDAGDAIIDWLDDAEETEDEDDSWWSDEGDDSAESSYDEDEGVLGDWIGTSSALKRAGTL